MKIILELQGAKYTYESIDGTDDFLAGELIEIFSRMLVSASFSPDVILPAERGKYECKYISDFEKEEE